MADVLALFAHPDDETFGPGGTIARLAAEGHRVHLISATRGEAGSIGESASMGREKLAAERTRELQDACRVLGVREPGFLDLPDSGLKDLPEEALLDPFVEAIRLVRPSLVLTFHPNGISGHDDHRTVTRRAQRAVVLAADPDWRSDLGPAHAVDRLWAYGFAEELTRRITWRSSHGIPAGDIDARLDVEAYVDAKMRAVDAHASQKPFIVDLETRLGSLEGWWSPEVWVLLAGVPLPERPVDDLFAGLGE